MRNFAFILYSLCVVLRLLKLSYLLCCIKLFSLFLVVIGMLQFNIGLFGNFTLKIYLVLLKRLLKLLHCIVNPEACVTSNLLSKTVDGTGTHHFWYWHSKQHPVILCVSEQNIFKR